MSTNLYIHPLPTDTEQHRFRSSYELRNMDYELSRSVNSKGKIVTMGDGEQTSENNKVYMKLFDYFFCVQVRLQIKFLKKNVEDSRFSAALATSLWSTFFMFGLLSCLGLLWDHKVLLWAVDNNSSFFISTMIMGGLMVLRYFRFVKYEKLDMAFNKKHVYKQKLIVFLFWLFLLGAPVFFAVSFRLYVLGHV